MPRTKSTTMLFANVKIKSVSGQSIFNAKKLVTSDDVSKYHGDIKLFRPAIQILQSLGFSVLHVGRSSINIAGSQSLFEQVFKGSITSRKVTMKSRRSYRFWDVEGSRIKGLISSSKTPLEKYVEGISLCQPMDFFWEIPTPSASPPWSPLLAGIINVPDDVSRLLNADAVHEQGIRGDWVRVIVTDSGLYHHPYYDEHDYMFPQVQLAGAAAPDRDDFGHGTWVTALLFAIAPKADVQFVKDYLAWKGIRNVLLGFQIAAQWLPDVISCSWGHNVRTIEDLTSEDLLLAYEISQAVSDGICVVFAAGNGDYGFPAQHPDVIAVGGVYIDLYGNMQASNYASGFESQIFDRSVPDVCGLVGRAPYGQYIMMPTQPNSRLDRVLASPPRSDSTRKDDGWLVASGTSAAAPQVAGVCALMRQVRPELGPHMIKRVLMETARDVVSGHANVDTGGAAAHMGRDTATGAGLVDCAAAVEGAQSIPADPWVYDPDIGEADLRSFDPRYLDPIMKEWLDRIITPPPDLPWAANPASFPSRRAIVNRFPIEPRSRSG